MLISLATTKYKNNYDLKKGGVILFCPNCGNQTENTDAFCDKCGCCLAEQGNSHSISYANQVSNIVSKSSKTKRRWIIPLSVITVIVVIAAIAILLFPKPPLSVNEVKNSQLNGYNHISIGKSFERYFDSTSWESFESEEGLGVVEFYVDY